MNRLLRCLCLTLLLFMTMSCDTVWEEKATGKLEVPDKALFIGNSLLLGNGTFGMNATCEDCDYHTILQKRFLEKNPAYTDIRLSGTGFEACENEKQQRAWLENMLQPRLSDDLDLVVVQIGENVNTQSKRAAFVQGARALVRTIRSGAPRARIVWMYGWYASNQVTTAIKDACRPHDVALITINDIRTAVNSSSIGTVVTRTEPTSQTLKYTRYAVLPDNRLQIDFTIGGRAYQATVQVTGYSDNVEAKTLTWQGYETITTDEGVASHPGDRGFEQIARRFFEVLRID